MPSLKAMLGKSASKPFYQEKNLPKNDLPAYDLSLVGSLKYDHEQILVIYENIISAAEEKEYPKIQLLLKDFTVALTNHIQQEDEQLYGYLKTLAEQESKTTKKVIDRFTSEMKNISIEIFSFLSQSPCIPVNDNTVDKFIVRFNEIGKELLNRINHEEKVLYPIYANSRTVVNIS